MRRLVVLALVALVTCGPGCGKKPAPRRPRDRPAPEAPVPPEPVNAIMPRPLLGLVEPPAGDTVVLGRFESAAVYTTVRSGDWDHRFHLVVYRIVRVERGNWKPKRIVFVVRDEWPAPGNWIKLRKGPLIYSVGTFYAFGLQTGSKPATIIGRQQRSRLAPHGPAIRNAVDNRDEVMAAAWTRVKKSFELKGGGSSIVETLPGKCVVELVAEHKGARHTWVLTVDTRTLKAEIIDSDAEDKP